VTAEKGKAAIEISYSDARSLLFSGVSYCDNRERDFMFDYDKKEKEHQNTRQHDKHSGAKPPRTNRTNQIASCLDALSITYLVYKCRLSMKGK
jgi:hypothetical protein